VIRFLFLSLAVIYLSCSKDSESPSDFVRFNIVSGATIQFSAPDTIIQQCEHGTGRIYFSKSALYSNAQDQRFQVQLLKLIINTPEADCVFDYSRTSDYRLTYTVSYDADHYKDYIFYDLDNLKVEVKTSADGTRILGSFEGLMVGMTPRRKFASPEPEGEPAPVDSIYVENGSFSVLIR
jgi:hypothetical protein